MPQGQSVEGMSHGSVLAKLKHGFHTNRLPWGFNADHQPVGGKYDSREDALVRPPLFLKSSSDPLFEISSPLLALLVFVPLEASHSSEAISPPPKFSISISISNVKTNKPKRS